jgi:cobalamin biosynthetic protein CobC
MEQQRLLTMRQQLQEQRGWLLVDEAFMDTAWNNSLASEHQKDGLIVLRSLGKFFGLAGLRLGFVIAPPEILQELEEQLSPWNVSHPARWVGRQALMDVQWQKVQRQRLVSMSTQWHEQLAASFPRLRFTLSPLFVSGVGDETYCEVLYRELGQLGVLVRLFDESGGQRMIRFGLPGEKQVAKVAAILRQVSEGVLCANT